MLDIVAGLGLGVLDIVAGLGLGRVGFIIVIVFIIISGAAAGQHHPHFTREIHIG